MFYKPFTRAFLYVIFNMNGGDKMNYKELVKKINEMVKQLQTAKEDTIPIITADIAESLKLIDNYVTDTVNSNDELRKVNSQLAMRVSNYVLNDNVDQKTQEENKEEETKILEEKAAAFIKSL